MKTCFKYGFKNDLHCCLHYPIGYRGNPQWTRKDWRNDYSSHDMVTDDKGLYVIGRAPTWSGKTLAFGIPLIARVPRAEPKHPAALVLAPTRELAEQIAERLLGRPVGSSGEGR